MKILRQNTANEGTNQEELETGNCRPLKAQEKLTLHKIGKKRF